MANKHVRVLDLQEPPRNFLKRCYDAMQSLGWIVSHTNESGIQGTVSMSMWSWGERISVRILNEQQVEVRSASALATQFIDWGRNRKNVEQLLGKIDALSRA